MNDRYKFIAFNDVGTALNNAVREDLSSIEEKLESLPASREKALILTNLEQAAMWLGKAIAHTDGFHR